MGESWILKVLNALIENKPEIVSDSGKAIKISVIEKKSINDVTIDNKISDLVNLVHQIQIELFSPSLDNIMVILEKFLPKKLEESDEIAYLKKLIIEDQENIKQLQEQIIILSRLNNMNEKARIMHYLKEDLEKLENYGSGIIGTWKDFQNHLAYVFKKYLGFREVPRTKTKEELAEYEEEGLREDIEKVKDLERGTVDIHLTTLNSKKFYSLHIEAKSSRNKASLRVDRILEHNSKVNADYLLVIGPKFAPIDIYNFIKYSQKYQENKPEFHFSIITIKALLKIIEFQVSRNLTQEFLIQLFNLDSLICDTDEITDILNSINLADNKDIIDYISPNLIVQEEERDIDEDPVLGILEYCERLYKIQIINYIFKDFVTEIQSEWQERSSLTSSIKFRKVHDIIYRLLKTRYRKQDLELNEELEKEIIIIATKFLVLFTIFDFIDFNPTDDMIIQLLNLETKVHIDPEETSYFKDSLGFFAQFF
ncbi:MAG: hypothetical protein ACFFG0_25170 [Candidatus Thorarchaeota archaeon]